MALQIRQTLRQTQQLVMTPQLQQAIKLLQYGHQEMISVLERELRENPVLEVASDDEPFTDQETADRNDLDSLEDLTKEPENPRAEILDVDWQSYLESYGRDRSAGNNDFSGPPPLENLATKQETLFDYLLAQLKLSPTDEHDRRIALEIIGNVDENGYLDIDLGELAEGLGTEEKEILRVLAFVQDFDPPGVACRDVRECLTIQARSLDPPNPLVVRILEEAFDLVQAGRPERVARKLKVSREELADALKVISSLDLRPGRPFLDRDTRYVIPDIYVLKVGNDYSVVLNDDGLPRLKISSFYQTQLHSDGLQAVTSDGSQAGTKNYIQEKMRGAMWLMKSIHQRQRTIYKVACSIIKFQREFFDKGINFLKPLVLKDVAMDVDMHESTISRVTANKYMHTPRGIFELKYFFNTGIRHGTDSIASESVKNQILRIVKDEDPKRPASDKRIVEELSKFKIRIARRTVAKYRELMGIPPSSKRRRKF